MATEIVSKNILQMMDVLKKWKRKFALINAIPNDVERYDALGAFQKAISSGSGYDAPYKRQVRKGKLRERIIYKLPVIIFFSGVVAFGFLAAAFHSLWSLVAIPVSVALGIQPNKQEDAWERDLERLDACVWERETLDKQVRQKRCDLKAAFEHELRPWNGPNGLNDIFIKVTYSPEIIAKFEKRLARTREREESQRLKKAWMADKAAERKEKRYPKGLTTGVAGC